MSLLQSIVHALALGAAAGLQDTAAEAVKQGYNAIKKYIGKTLPGMAVAVDQLERAPESKARQAVVEEDLARADAARDPELLLLAEQMLELIQRHRPDLSDTVGVSLASIKGASLRISDVESRGIGVRVTNAEITGDIDIRNIRAHPGRTKGPNS